MLNRRGLITGVLGLFAAPAIVRASSLMRVSMWRENAIGLVGNFAVGGWGPPSMTLNGIPIYLDKFCPPDEQYVIVV